MPAVSAIVALGDGQRPVRSYRTHRAVSVLHRCGVRRLWGSRSEVAVSQGSFPVADRDRVRWLDGVRGLAALYVVLHHVWLFSFSGFPADRGPWYLGWLLYGHLGVVVFIVVSGYSLTLSPRKNGFRLPGGKRAFARRRAWRILPPYWTALIMSLLLVTFVIAPRLGGGVTWRSLAVYGLLVQDITNAPAPNGTFWSIAVEAQIYVVFPLLLLLWRSRGVFLTAAFVTIGVTLAHLLATRVTMFARIEHFTPQLLVAYVFGMIAATSNTIPSVRGRSVPLLRISAAGAMYWQSFSIWRDRPPSSRTTTLWTWRLRHSSRWPSVEWPEERTTLRPDDSWPARYRGRWAGSPTVPTSPTRRSLRSSGPMWSYRLGYQHALHSRYCWLS